MKCPSDTKDLVNQNNISNFSLRYQYFLNYEDDGKVKFSVDATTLGSSQNLIDPLRDRQTNQINYLAKAYHVLCEFYELDWRMVIGLGGEHVQETNMTLDHVYGVPYLPGSAFKGVVRSWVIQEHFSNDEKRAMADDDFLKVFGNQKSAGKVQFLPAYPINNVRLSLDIMNPHFPDYYTGPTLPTDTQDPRPIKFLTVVQTPFRFIFLSKDLALKDLVQGWTDTALRNKGLGAKTASGYGYFRSQFNIPRTFRPDANFQIPQRTRPQISSLISLEEASQQFEDLGAPNPQLIDIIDIKNCAAQLAQVVTRDDLIELGQLEGIHPTLIEIDENYVFVSNFGMWVWENLKDELLSARILELPRLIYATAFRQKLKNLPSNELVSVQEELITISNQLEENNGGIGPTVVPDHFRYTSDPDRGNLTFSEYTN